VDRQLFVVGTFLDNGRILNRVIRFTEESGSGVNPTVIVDGIPAAEFHAGDAIEFGPDSKLYVATGDAGDPGDARDLQSLAGKILRYNADGTIPGDNPFPNSPVYAYGVRNVQGLAWHPESGSLFASEHGPSGFPNERFRRNNDELNVILAGKNYGWPDVAGDEEKAGSIRPIAVWNPGIAPAGLAVYNGPIAAWKNNIFVAALRGQQLRRVVIEPSNENAAAYRVVRNDALFKEDLGRLRAVLMGPDGHLYFTTSNWDGRGDPAATDDRILRLLPR
jgi:glucose/arabinose dehydrogenase